MKKVVIFDLDGLLIDSEIISYYLYCDLFAKYNISFSEEIYAKEYSGRSAVKNMTSAIEKYNLPITCEEGLTYVFERENDYIEKGVPLKPGARELLEYLKKTNCKMIVASSSIKDRALKILKQNDVLDYFDDMVYGAEVKNGKPHPDIFLKALEKSREKVEHAIVLEDSEAGIQAAYAAGIDVIGIADMKVPREEFQKMAVKMFPSLSEVIDYLKEAQ